MQPSNYYQLVLAHGIVMALAILWFIPIAIFAASFFRPVKVKTNANDLGRAPWQGWKIVHTLSNVVATALIIAGFTLGYYASGNSFQVGAMNAHFVIGLTFFIGILLQAIGGPIMTILNSMRKPDRRPLLNYPHIILGYLFTLLGAANIWLGLQQAKSPHYLYGLWIAAVAAWLVLYFAGIPLRRMFVSKRQGEHSEKRLYHETSPAVSNEMSR